ncbi:MAG: zf-TFIIB domain-containing protein [Planctomycetes bacterium]|nr:zf-TFIIB domain-containing protein [Planctomycetota bacterium]
MKCPACRTNHELKISELQAGFMVRKCIECDGLWIPSFQYWKWFRKQANILPEKPIEVENENPDSKHGKFCPECSTYLANRTIGHGLNFTIDHCFNCKGYWLDKGEWEALNKKDLHDELHLIFTEHWQTEVKQSQAERSQENAIIKALGDNDYNKARLFKEWLCQHEKAGVILNYITQSRT